MTVWSFATRQYLWQIPPWYWLYSLVSYFLAFNWEVSRKIRAPEDEVEGVDSYTRLFGTYVAAQLVLWIRVISTILVAFVAHHLGLSIWFYALLLLLFLVCLFGFVQYRYRTSARTARLMELSAAIYILAFDLALAIELGRTYGLRISGEL
jgi:4-hydroxybenzoate polyprenyltransferase